MNPSKTITAGLVGLLALGGSLGIGTQIASAQDDTAPDTAQEQQRDGQRDGRKDGRRGASTAVISELLGLDAEALHQARENGTTLAELAVANGVSESDLIDALVDAASARIDEKVASMGLDQARADEIKADLEVKITDRVNGVRPEGNADGERGPRGERGLRGGGQGIAGVDAQA